MLGRKASFWLAVGGVAILAQFAVEVAARKIPNAGLQRFVQFIHCGPGGSQ
jgi:hypothetical protein